jgi:seryl-tRNA synthetase
VPIPFLTELFELINKHGYGPVLLVFAVVIALLGWRSWMTTRNKVDESDADARNRKATAEAEALTKLASGLHEMAESNNAIVRLTTEDMRDSRAHREKMLTAIADLMGQMKGINLAQVDDGKARARMLTTLHEIEEQFTPLRTDLRDINVRTAGMEASFIRALDERFAPMMALAIGINAQVNALAAVAQTSGQSAEAVLQEAAKINMQLGQIVSEFSLLKDMIFDRDDRIGDILKSFGSQEKMP